MAAKDLDMKQQGDVVLRRVQAIPDTAMRKARSSRGFVLFEGEVTGHAHVIAEPTLDLYEADGKLYLRTDHTVTVTHEEHAPVTLEPGVWEIDRVREYDYLKDMERRVVD